MPEADSFRTLIRQIRAGDQPAAAELVRQYEPEIRRAVRMRLRDRRLRRMLDSMDICQSVLANFFIRAAAGQFELDEPEQLLKLLVKMAQNKLLNQVARHQADRRDCRRLDAGRDHDLDAFATVGPSPSALVAGQELLQEMRRRLSDDERYLAEQRALGRDWAEIATQLGASPEALRKRHARALDRVTRELGLGEACGD